MQGLLKVFRTRGAITLGANFTMAIEHVLSSKISRSGGAMVPLAPLLTQALQMNLKICTYTYVCKIKAEKDVKEQKQR